MKLVLLGTGAAWPDEYRSSPGFLIDYNNKQYLIECGPGTSNQILKAGYKPTMVDYVFLTHYHVDHCIELPLFIKGTYLTERPNDITVYGPVGTDEFMDNLMNKACWFIKDMVLQLRNREIKITTKEFRKGKVFEEEGLTVECIPVKHDDELMNSIAYKFTAEGKTVVFTGDLAPCDTIVELAKDADILVIEASFPGAPRPKGGHISPAQAAQIAKDANVKKVILVHLFPPHRGKEEDTLAEVKAIFPGEIELGEDLKEYIV